MNEAGFVKNEEFTKLEKKILELEEKIKKLSG
jgi:hypothetical protein